MEDNNNNDQTNDTPPSTDGEVKPEGGEDTSQAGEQNGGGEN